MNLLAPSRLSRLALLLLFILAMGCTPKAEKAATGSAKPLPRPDAPPTAAREGKPSDVLVKIDGEVLTRGEADIEVNNRMTSLRSQIPLDRIEPYKDRMRHYVVEQFVARTLLAGEAARMKISISPADETKAFEQIRASLPPGVSLETVMKESPMGEKKMREMVLTGVRIEQLLARYLTNDVPATDQELADYTSKHRDDIAAIPEHVQARHILIATGPQDDAKSRASKKAQAEDIRKQILMGADFAAMARKHSTCPSASRGGDLGDFKRGQIVKAFDDAAFSQKVNDIGPVTETSFGYHIIQVLNHSPAGAMSRERIAQRLNNERKQKRIENLVEELRKNARIEYGAGMAPVSQKAP